MTDDTLREECEKLIYRLTHVDTNWDCCLTSKDAIDTLLAFARVQQAAGLREAKMKIQQLCNDECRCYVQDKSGVNHPDENAVHNGNVIRVAAKSWVWCEAQATAREKGDA